MKIHATISNLAGNVLWDGEVDADIDPDEGRTKPTTISFTLPVDETERVLGIEPPELKP